jgi:hypothetical protein
MTATWLVGLPWVVFALLSLAGALGLLAIVSPTRFARVAQSGGYWVDTRWITDFLDRPISVDHHVLRYSRSFGVLVVASSLWLAYLFAVLFGR